MKKFLLCTTKVVLLLSLILFLFMVCLGIKSCYGSDVVYLPGRDTTMLFGDGSFQICRNSDGNEGLFSGQYGSCIIQYVEAVQETETKAYIVGYTPGWSQSDGSEIFYRNYAVIDLNNNIMQLCAILDASIEPENRYYSFSMLDEMIEKGQVVVLSSIADFSEVDQSVFQNLT